MSTPIETNTEELREILQTVYNLPMAGGGSAEPDLVITPSEEFAFTNRNVDSTYNVTKVSFDPKAVVSTYEKLIAGKDVRVVFTGYLTLNSWTPKIMTTQPAMRAIAYGPEVGDENYNELVTRFTIAYSYFFMSDDNGTCDIEFRFVIDPGTSDVQLLQAVVHS